MTRILAIVLSLIGGALLAQQNHPADGMQAPDKIHSVAIVHSALPGSDLYDGFFTIEVRRDGRALSRYPTCGFLVDVLWSPNGKYVAVRNRRGTSGDYTWVFRLSDGHAVKQPDDEGSAKDLISRVRAKFPEYENGGYYKSTVRPHAWLGPDRLQLESVIGFTHVGSHEPVRVLDTYEVSESGMQRIETKFEKPK